MQSSRGDCEKERPRIHKESAHSAISTGKVPSCVASGGDVSSVGGDARRRTRESATPGVPKRPVACDFVDTAVQNGIDSQRAGREKKSVVVEKRRTTRSTPFGGRTSALVTGASGAPRRSRWKKQIRGRSGGGYGEEEAPGGGPDEGLSAGGAVGCSPLWEGGPFGASPLPLGGGGES